uniref:Uncharacterized protein n=1 Tax=Setaria italica TaxID=4555 RepID=K3Y3V8_SETIT
MPMRELYHLRVGQMSSHKKTNFVSRSHRKTYLVTKVS